MAEGPPLGRPVPLHERTSHPIIRHIVGCDTTIHPLPTSELLLGHRRHQSEDVWARPKDVYLPRSLHHRTRRRRSRTDESSDAGAWIGDWGCDHGQ